MVEVGRNQPCPCGSGKKYKKCHLAADEELAAKKMAAAPVATPAAPPGMFDMRGQRLPSNVRAPTRFNTIVGPEVLQILGPVVIAEWAVPTPLAQQLQREGKPVPPPIGGHMLIDTGAGCMAIGPRTVQQLGLKPVGMRNISGAHGRQQSERYFARWSLRISERAGQEVRMLEIANDMECIAIPNLEANFDGLATNPDGSPVRVIGIVGRDFMRHMRFTYDGPRGQMDYEVDLSAFRPA